MENSEVNHQVNSPTRDIKKAKVEAISQEYDDIKGNLQAICAEIQKQRKIHESNTTNNESLSKTAKALIKKQREEIKTLFDQLERAVEEEVDAVKEKNQQQQETLLRKLDSIEDGLKTLVSSVENKLSTEQKLQQGIRELEDKLARLVGENTITDYMYQQSQKIAEMLTTVKEMGSVVQQRPEISAVNQIVFGDRKAQDTIEANQVADSVDSKEEQTEDNEELEHSVAIRTRTKEDSQQSTITGLCIMSNCYIAVVDYGNRSVKMINTKENKIVSTLPMLSDPHDITKVTDDLVAVTLFYKKQIQFLSMDQSKSLSVTSVIDADSPCYGVIHLNDKIYVTQSNKVQILDKTGKVLQSFDSDSEGNQLFSHAKYLALSPDLRTIYVSDYTNNAVTALSTDGMVKAIYKDRDLRMPYGLAVDSKGYIYVCGYDSSNIHKLSGDLSSGKVILDESDGIVMPQSIGYSARQNRLYVGMWCNDTIRVYQL